MKKPLKIIIGVFVAVGLSYFALISFVSFGGLTDSDCKEHQEKRAASPTQLYVASYTQRICKKEKTTTAFITVHDNNIKNSSLVLKANANALILNIELKWKNKSTLIVEYPKGTNVMLTSQPKKTSSVFVIFREKNS